MPILSFTLSMPNNNAWNGKWSGKDTIYAITKGYPNTKKGKVRAEQIAAGSYYHNFGDGWGARVDAKIVTPQEARRIRKESKGFCGYEWMVSSILQHGKIQT